TITNVPGPALPVYFAGARITQQIGMAPILDGLGLTIVVLSYAGRLSLGITSCYTVIPDPAWLGECMERALDELESALAEESTANLHTDALREDVRVAKAGDHTARQGSRRKERRSVSGSEALERLRSASKALDKAIESLQKRTRKR
ncbi:MAG: WS/DGAT domain-containing protein, partial [Lysobacterales bacterium]